MKPSLKDLGVWQQEYACTIAGRTLWNTCTLVTTEHLTLAVTPV